MTRDRTRPTILSGDLGMDDVVVPRRSGQREDFADGCVVLSESGGIVTLSGSARAILDALDGVRTVEQAAAVVAAAFEVDRATVQASMLSAVRRLAALGLMENVVVEGALLADEADAVESSPPADSGEQPCGPGDPANTPAHLARRGLPEPGSCLGRRLHLDEAEFIDLAAPWFTMAISVSGAALSARLGRLFGPCVTDEEHPVGLAVVGRAGPLKGARPIYTIFDGTGYRAWRGRRLREVEQELLAMLSPLRPDPARRRAFVDLRALRRGGQALLVHPYVLDDVRVMKACERVGWEISGPLVTEVDLDTGRALRREPFDPLDPGREPAVVSADPIVGLLLGVSPQGGADIYALDALLRRHLDLVDGSTDSEAMPTYAEIVRNIPVAAVPEPSRPLYLEAFLRLEAAIG